MTPVLCCGFEEGIAGPHWTLAASSFTTSSPLSGLRSLRCNPTASTQSALSVDSFGAGILILRFRVKFTTLPSASTAVGGLSSGGTGAAYSSGFIFAQADQNNGSGVPVTTGIAYCIDIKINTTANPWRVDVQVNGVSCEQATAALAADTSAQQVRIGFRPGIAITADALFDDVLVSTSAADYPIGPGFVYPYVCIADGTHNIAGAADFQRGNSGTDILNATTTAFQLIDDVPMPSGTVDEADNIRAVAPPNATDYVECLFGPASGIATPAVAPRAVEAIIAHHQIATQSGQMVVELNDNGTIDTLFDTGAAAGVVTYRYARKHYASGPAGPWVIGGGGNGDFTDLRLRFRAPDAAPDQCLDAAMIEAEFDGPLLTKQTLNIGTDITVGEDLVASPPTSYEVSDSITETASSVVTTTVFNETTEGETPQQQCVIESNGGDDTGTTIVNPGQHVFVRVQVSGANTDVGLSGVSNP